MAKEQKKFHWLEQGTDKPLYTVFAVSEKMALKKLYRFLEKIGKQDIELVKAEG